MVIMVVAAHPDFREAMRLTKAGFPDLRALLNNFTRPFEQIQESREVYLSTQSAFSHQSSSSSYPMLAITLTIFGENNFAKHDCSCNHRRWP
jgi:hypothetical protein